MIVALLSHFEFLFIGDEVVILGSVLLLQYLNIIVVVVVSCVVI